MERSTYNPDVVRDYYDRRGIGEDARLRESPSGRASFALHSKLLQRFLRPGMRVLEIGAGPGIFTSVMHDLDCRVRVRDLSPIMVEENKRLADENGFAPSVIDWGVADICDLGEFAGGEFDAVVAYGGPLSYVFDEAARAMQEIRRVTRPGGKLLASVMSLWGTLVSGIGGVLRVPPESNRKIIATGDLTEEVLPGHGHYCRLYDATRFQALLENGQYTVRDMKASGVIALARGETLQSVVDDDILWNHLIELEMKCCDTPGALNMGTHIIAAAVRD